VRGWYNSRKFDLIWANHQKNLDKPRAAPPRIELRLFDELGEKSFDNSALCGYNVHIEIEESYDKSTV